MRCDTTTLEIETIVNRIENNDINLQPDFQRGEVWSLNKKKKLIDSILRGWKIPPIHLVQANEAVDEVLDGQQRLVAIKDFIKDQFSIDGNIRPLDSKIKELDGYRYSQLPQQTQRLYKKYSLTIIRLTEYNPEEPAELFYRLNQPVSLTAAEQRNAYVGTTRDQIKDLVKHFVKLGADKETLGFSNSRLAYDEIVSKFCYAVEIKTLRKKIAANDISDKYRSNIPFSNVTMKISEQVLTRLMATIVNANDNSIYKPKFSKATLFSWLVFIKNHSEIEDAKLAESIMRFEASRDFLKGKIKDNLFENYSEWFNPLLSEFPFFEVMINTYNQRASMGSTDALSIIYRDIIINVFYSVILDDNNSLLFDFKNFFEENQNLAITLDEIYDKYKWGEVF